MTSQPAPEDSCPGSLSFEEEGALLECRIKDVAQATSQDHRHVPASAPAGGTHPCSPRTLPPAAWCHSWWCATSHLRPRRHSLPPAEAPHLASPHNSEAPLRARNTAVSPGHEVATGEKKKGTDSQGGGKQGRKKEGKSRQKVGWGRGEKKLDLAAHLLTGQPNPQWRLQPSGSLCEEGLGVGIRHTCQAGISALTQQEGILPAQWLLQQSEGAVEVGELSARGRGCCCWGWVQGGVYREGGQGSGWALPALPHPQV